uniref:Uncharacterized protein n=1 Tax=Arundo donax TaxID=35708 RepID=A0A0A9HHL9_ARUDO
MNKWIPAIRCFFQSFLMELSIRSIESFMYTLVESFLIPYILSCNPYILLPWGFYSIQPQFITWYQEPKIRVFLLDRIN